MNHPEVLLIKITLKNDTGNLGKGECNPNATIIHSAAGEQSQTCNHQKTARPQLKMILL